MNVMVSNQFSSTLPPPPPYRLLTLKTSFVNKNKQNPMALKTTHVTHTRDETSRNIPIVSQHFFLSPSSLGSNSHFSFSHTHFSRYFFSSFHRHTGRDSRGIEPEKKKSINFNPI